MWHIAIAFGLVARIKFKKICLRLACVTYQLHNQQKLLQTCITLNISSSCAESAVVWCKKFGFWLNCSDSRNILHRNYCFRFFFFFGAIKTRTKDKYSSWLLTSAFYKCAFICRSSDEQASESESERTDEKRQPELPHVTPTSIFRDFQSIYKVNESQELSKYVITFSDGLGA